MTEDPTKLFATRADRFPQPNEIDATRTALEKAAELVPIFGPATVQVIGQFLVPGIERRREEWFKELADDFDRLKETVDGFSVENLPQNEAFVSATIQATRIAIGTHQEKKRKYLRNALLNIAVGKTPDDIKQQIFLNAIEAFTPAHVQALDLIWRGAGQKIAWDQNSIGIGQRNYGAAVGILVPEVKGQPSLLGAIFADLRNRGFSNLGGARTIISAGRNHHESGHRISELRVESNGPPEMMDTLSLRGIGQWRAKDCGISFPHQHNHTARRVYREAVW